MERRVRATGEIEHLRVDSSTVDVIISNCVIDLAIDKLRVFQEAYRVLKPGGTLMVSDMVLLEELPEYIRNSVEAYVRCVGGAMRKDEYLEAIGQAGFEKIKVVGETRSPAELIAEQPVLKELVESLKVPMSEVQRLGATVVSLKVSAKRRWITDTRTPGRPGIMRTDYKPDLKDNGKGVSRKARKVRKGNP